MPSMKKFPEFELSQKFLEIMTSTIGPTRMNKSSPATRSRLMALAAKTAVEVGMIIDGKELHQLSWLPAPGSGIRGGGEETREDDLLP